MQKTCHHYDITDVDVSNILYNTKTTSDLKMGLIM